MASPLTSLVVGAGEIADQHLGYLAASPHADLVCVCDLSEAAASRAARTFGARAHSTDLRDALDRHDPDVVHILTPPATHMALARMALDVGAHVICEKPLTLSAGETRELLAHAADVGRVVVESQNLRFNDQMHHLREHVLRGDLGTPLRAEVSIALPVAGGGKFADALVRSPAEAMPGGVVHDFLPHQVYLLLEMLGWPAATDVASRWHLRSGNPRVKYDEMTALLDFDNGTSGVLSFSAHTHPDHFRLVLRGSEGTLETDMYHPYMRLDVARSRAMFSGMTNLALAGAGMMRSSVRNFRDKVFQHGAYHGMPRMLERTYVALRDGAAPPITPFHMQRTADVVDACLPLQPSEKDNT